MGKKRKAINFDFDIKLLKTYYPSRHYLNAYRDIKRFFKNNDFIWRQGSGYVSTKPLSDVDVRRIVVLMSLKYPWLKKSVNKFDVTDVGKNYSLVDIIKEEVHEKDVLLENSEFPEKPSLDSIISNALKKSKDIKTVDKSLLHEQKQER